MKRTSQSNKKSLSDRFKYLQFKYLQEDLEDIQHYLEEFSAFLPLPIISVNPVGFILDVNKAFEELIGLDKIEILGQPVKTFFLETKKLQKIEQEVLENKSVKNQEMTLLAKKRRVPVSVYLAPRRDKQGNVIGYFIGIYDITEFKKLQETLEEKVKERTKELQIRVEELEKFHQLTVGRELKMVELKKEIEKLKKELEKYKLERKSNNSTLKL